MAHLNRGLTATSENISVKVNEDGKKVEIETKFESVTNWTRFDDLMQLLDYKSQLDDCVQTLVNELNQSKTVELTKGV